MIIAIENHLAASIKGILINCFKRECERGNVIENLIQDTLIICVMLVSYSTF